MSIRNLILALLAAAYVVMWVGGVGSHTFFDGPPADAYWAAPLFLFLAGFIVIVTTGAPVWSGLFVILVSGFVLEIVGVRYGFLFGKYIYTDALRPKLFGVPLVMASAWLVVTAYVKQMLMILKLSGWLEILSAALWMTAIDLVIDPLASGILDYWRWSDGGVYYGVPTHNFVGWFAVSLIIFAIIKGFKWQANLWACHVGLSIILFFSTIALAEGLLLAGGLGVALSIAHLIVLSSSYRKQTRFRK